MKLRIVLPAPVPRTLVRYGFLLVGVVCLGLYSYEYCERTLYQAYASWEFDRTIAHQPVPAPATPASDAAGPRGRLVRVTSRSRRPAPSASAPSSTEVIGRLSVPRLHLSAMVLEGIDRHTLQLAIGHVPDTALPGEAGNIGLAGHRDSFFRGLKDLRTGDEIRFATTGGDFEYVVESLVVVEPANIAVLGPTSDNLLTLVTCYPFSYIGNAPKRFVARARQVSPAAAVVE